MKRITMTLLSLFLFFGCDVTGNNSSPVSTNNNGTTIVGSRGKIHDSNGVFIGYATSLTSDSITVYTTKGYLIMLSWDGAINTDSTYYATTDCTGIAYDIREVIPPSKAIVYNSHSDLLTYIPDTNGLAKPSSITRDAINSYYDYYTEQPKHNTTYGDSSKYIFELQSISRADAGLPDTIGVLTFTPE